MRDVTIAANGCPAAVPGTDCSAAIQAHANYLFNNHGGRGLLYFPGDGAAYLIGTTVELYGCLGIKGDHWATIFQTIGDRTAFVFGGANHLVSDVVIIGHQACTAVNPVTKVANNVCMFMDRVTIWYGATAIENRGNDGRYRDCFFWGYQSCMQNFGNNWYFGVKFDDCGVLGPNGQPWVTPFSVINGSGVLENYYFGCDFSGNFGYSYYSSSTIGHFSKHIGCVMSSPIDVAFNGWCVNVATTFGSQTFNGNGAALTFDACYKIGPPLTPYAGGSGLRRMGWDSHYNIL
jgi:hypothetical protein